MTLLFKLETAVLLANIVSVLGLLSFYIRYRRSFVHPVRIWFLLLISVLSLPRSAIVVLGNFLRQTDFFCHCTAFLLTTAQFARSVGITILNLVSLRIVVQKVPAGGSKHGNGKAIFFFLLSILCVPATLICLGTAEYKIWGFCYLPRSTIAVPILFNVVGFVANMALMAVFAYLISRRRPQGNSGPIIKAGIFYACSLIATFFFAIFSAILPEEVFAYFIPLIPLQRTMPTLVVLGVFLFEAPRTKAKGLWSARMVLRNACARGVFKRWLCDRGDRARFAELENYERLVLSTSEPDSADQLNRPASDIDRRAYEELKLMEGRLSKAVDEFTKSGLFEVEVSSTVAISNMEVAISSGLMD